MRVFQAALLGLSLLCSCRKEPPKPAGPPVFDIKVTEKGFEPSRVEVAPAQDVTLRITRKVDPSCADAVDIQGDPVRHMLPLDRTVELHVTAPASGEIAFACPMKMFRGAIVVTGQH